MRERSSAPSLFDRVIAVGVEHRVIARLAGLVFEESNRARIAGLDVPSGTSRMRARAFFGDDARAGSDRPVLRGLGMKSCIFEIPPS